MLGFVLPNTRAVTTYLFMPLCRMSGGEAAAASGVPSCVFPDAEERALLDALLHSEQPCTSAAAAAGSSAAAAASGGSPPSLRPVGGRPPSSAVNVRRRRQQPRRSVSSTMPPPPLLLMAAGVGPPQPATLGVPKLLAAHLDTADIANDGTWLASAVGMGGGGARGGRGAGGSGQQWGTSTTGPGTELVALGSAGVAGVPRPGSAGAGGGGWSSGMVRKDQPQLLLLPYEQLHMHTHAQPQQHMQGSPHVGGGGGGHSHSRARSTPAAGGGVRGVEAGEAAVLQQGVCLSGVPPAAPAAGRDVGSAWAAQDEVGGGRDADDDAVDTAADAAAAPASCTGAGDGGGSSLEGGGVAANCSSQRMQHLQLGTHELTPPSAVSVPQVTATTLSSGAGGTARASSRGVSGGVISGGGAGGSAIEHSLHTATTGDTAGSGALAFPIPLFELTSLADSGQVDSGQVDSDEESNWAIASGGTGLLAAPRPPSAPLLLPTEAAAAAATQQAVLMRPARVVRRTAGGGTEDTDGSGVSSTSLLPPDTQHEQPAAAAATGTAAAGHGAVEGDNDGAGAEQAQLSSGRAHRPASAPARDVLQPPPLPRQLAAAAALVNVSITGAMAPSRGLSSPSDHLSPFTRTYAPSEGGGPSPRPSGARAADSAAAAGTQGPPRATAALQVGLPAGAAVSGGGGNGGTGAATATGDDHREGPDTQGNTAGPSVHAACAYPSAAIMGGSAWPAAAHNRWRRASCGGGPPLGPNGSPGPGGGSARASASTSAAARGRGISVGGGLLTPLSPAARDAAPASGALQRLMEEALAAAAARRRQAALGRSSSQVREQGYALSWILLSHNNWETFQVEVATAVNSQITIYPGSNTLKTFTTSIIGNGLLLCGRRCPSRWRCRRSCVRAPSVPARWVWPRRGTRPYRLRVATAPTLLLQPIWQQQ